MLRRGVLLFNYDCMEEIKLENVGLRLYYLVPSYMQVHSMSGLDAK